MGAMGDHPLGILIKNSSKFHEKCCYHMFNLTESLEYLFGQQGKNIGIGGNKRIPFFLM